MLFVSVLSDDRKGNAAKSKAATVLIEGWRRLSSLQFVVCWIGLMVMVCSLRASARFDWLEFASIRTDCGKRIKRAFRLQSRRCSQKTMIGSFLARTDQSNLSLPSPPFCDSSMIALLAVLFCYVWYTCFSFWYAVEMLQG